MLLLAVAISTSIIDAFESHGDKLYQNNCKQKHTANYAQKNVLFDSCFSVDLMICHRPCELVSLLCVYFSSGVSDKAFVDPVVWLTALLTAWTAVLPSVTALALNVITIHDKHKVRHLHKEVN